jgi:hypothetical protein
MFIQTEKYAGKIKTELVSLAGEYAVASELCRMGMYAQITMGNHKKTDILVENRERLFSISVKTKTGSEWVRVTGIWQPYDFLVLVDFKDKTVPEFYVLGLADWKKTVKAIRNRKLASDPDDGAKIDKHNTMYWDPIHGKKKVWIGCSVRLDDVKNYHASWKTIANAARI